jgi:hypothetical protein
MWLHTIDNLSNMVNRVKVYLWCVNNDQFPLFCCLRWPAVCCLMAGHGVEISPCENGKGGRPENPLMHGTLVSTLADTIGAMERVT